MKITFVVLGVVLLHLVLAILVRPYGQLVIAIGGWMSYGNDIADLPRLFAYGFALSGGVLAAAVATLGRSMSPPSEDS
jgi:hypothetical protein